jgi:hypothetical protein
MHNCMQYALAFSYHVQRSLQGRSQLRESSAACHSKPWSGDCTLILHSVHVLCHELRSYAARLVGVHMQRLELYRDSQVHITQAPSKHGK